MEVGPTKIDTAASDACSRSGAFALLLSLALLSVIPYWSERQNDIALGRYVSLRLSLETAVELLNDNFYWQKYKSSNEAAESASVLKLLDVWVEENPSSEGNVPPVQQSRTGTAPQNKARRTDIPGLRPAAPTLLSVTMKTQIHEIHQIADFLVALDDSDVLTKGRSASVFYNVSIYRWASKRNSLVGRNAYANSCTLTGVRQPAKAHQPEYFVPALGKETLLKCLNLRDVRELAGYELPKIPDTTKFGVRGEREVDMSPGSFPRDLYLASLFAQGLLVFVILYFNAFAREAVSSENFPPQGTMFSAFSRSAWTLAAFTLALWLPFFASLAVAVTSRKWLLMVCSVLIGSVVFSTTVVLQRKSYLRIPSLQSLVLRNRRRSGPISGHS